MRRKSRGMTLVELITVMVIIATLTAITVPAYRNYIVRANRTDAKTALMSTAGALERCFTRANTYVGCALGLPRFVGVNNTYQIQLAAVGVDTYTLQAVPQGTQASKDTACATFALNAASQRTVTGTYSGHAQDCWGK